MVLPTRSCNVRGRPTTYQREALIWYWLPVAGQQLADLVGLVLRDAGDHAAEVGEGFCAMELAGAKQGSHESGMAGSAVAADEQMIFTLLGRPTR